MMMAANIFVVVVIQADDLPVHCLHAYIPKLYRRVNNNRLIAESNMEGDHKKRGNKTKIFNDDFFNDDDDDGCKYFCRRRCRSS